MINDIVILARTESAGVSRLNHMGSKLDYLLRSINKYATNFNKVHVIVPQSEGYTTDDLILGLMADQKTVSATIQTMADKLNLQAVVLDVQDRLKRIFNKYAVYADALQGDRLLRINDVCIQLRDVNNRPSNQSANVILLLAELETICNEPIFVNPKEINTTYETLTARLNALVAEIDTLINSFTSNFPTTQEALDRLDLFTSKVEDHMYLRDQLYQWYYEYLLHSITIMQAQPSDKTIIRRENGSIIDYTLKVNPAFKNPLTPFAPNVSIDVEPIKDLFDQSITIDSLIDTLRTAIKRQSLFYGPNTDTKLEENLQNAFDAIQLQVNQVAALDVLISDIIQVIQQYTGQNILPPPPRIQNQNTPQPTPQTTLQIPPVYLPIDEILRPLLDGEPNVIRVSEKNRDLLIGLRTDLSSYTYINAILFDGLSDRLHIIQTSNAVENTQIGEEFIQIWGKERLHNLYNDVLCLSLTDYSDADSFIIIDLVDPTPFFKAPISIDARFYLNTKPLLAKTQWTELGTPYVINLPSDLERSQQKEFRNLSGPYILTRDAILATKAYMTDPLYFILDKEYPLFSLYNYIEKILYTDISYYNYQLTTLTEWDNTPYYSLYESYNFEYLRVNEKWDILLQV